MRFMVGRASGFLGFRFGLLSCLILLGFAWLLRVMTSAVGHDKSLLFKRSQFSSE